MNDVIEIVLFCLRRQFTVAILQSVSALPEHTPRLDSFEICGDTKSRLKNDVITHRPGTTIITSLHDVPQSLTLNTRCFSSSTLTTVGYLPYE